MKSLFGGIAICMLAGLFSAGCSGCRQESKPEELQTYGDDPTGTGGTNGLTPPVFHQWAAELNQLMSSYALTTSQVAEPPVQTIPRTDIKLPYIFQLSRAYATFYQQLIAAGGRKILDYAIGCAFGKDYGVRYPDQQIAMGNGLLSITQSWAVGPLDLTKRNAVFTCLIARMNAAGEEVPIRLVGKYVPNTPLTAAEQYPIEEAVWIAHWELDQKTGLPGLFLDVWPSPTLILAKQFDFNDRIRSRVCDQTQTFCGLTIHSSAGEPGSECEKTSDNWFCKEQAAIETRLGEPGWNVIYVAPP